MIRLKNISGEIKQLHIHEFQIDEILDIDNTWYIDSIITSISNEEFEIHNENGKIEGINKQIDWLRGSFIEASIISQVNPPPFAEPTFRTKINATASITTIPYNETTTIDFQLTTERYVSGGCIVIENAKLGDYVTAEVYDKDSIIPEAYRTSLCENWPCVSKYIEKQWLTVCGFANCIHEIDTKPLNAKISAGLYLRVTYYPNSEGDSRKVGINYYLTKKL